MEFLRTVLGLFGYLFLVSLPFLFWWSWWRGKQKKYIAQYGEVFELLFIIRQKDTGIVHGVYFGEISGTVCPTLGETRGRYENLSYMCPEYEYEVIEGGILCPLSLQVKDLNNSVGEWIDQYWNLRFEEKK